MDAKGRLEDGATCFNRRSYCFTRMIILAHTTPVLKSQVLKTREIGQGHLTPLISPSNRFSSESKVVCFIVSESRTS